RGPHRTSPARPPGPRSPGPPWPAGGRSAGGPPDCPRRVRSRRARCAAAARGGPPVPDGAGGCWCPWVPYCPQLAGLRRDGAGRACSWVPACHQLVDLLSEGLVPEGVAQQPRLPPPGSEPLARRGGRVEEQLARALRQRAHLGDHVLAQVLVAAVLGGGGAI